MLANSDTVKALNWMLAQKYTFKLLHLMLGLSDSVKALYWMPAKVWHCQDIEFNANQKWHCQSITFNGGQKYKHYQRIELDADSIH